MASRFGPGVRPFADDPFATALNELQASFMAAREQRRRRGIEDEERARQRRIDDERAADRKRQQQAQDLELALRGVRRGRAPTIEEPATGPTLGGLRRSVAGASDAPAFVTPDSPQASEFGTIRRMLSPPQRTALMPQVDETPIRGGIVPPQQDDVDPVSLGVSALSEARALGRQAFREPRLLAAPGAFVPGVGFTPQAIYEPTPELGLQRPATVSRPDPRFEQLTPEFYRERPVDETEQLVQMLVAEGIPENRARIAARNTSLLDDLLFPREERESPVRWERFTDEQGNVWQIHPETGETRRLPLRGRVPDSGGESASDAERRRTRMEREAADYAALLLRHGGRRGDSQDIANVAALVASRFPDLPRDRAAAIASDAAARIASSQLIDERRQQQLETGGRGDPATDLLARILMGESAPGEAQAANEAAGVPGIGRGGAVAQQPVTLDDEEASAARELVSDMSDADARAALTAAGYSPAEIDRILGGR